MILDGNTIRRESALNARLALLRLSQTNDKLLNELWSMEQRAAKRKETIREAIQLIASNDLAAATLALQSALE